MKISYAILVCNEIDEIKKLIPHLLKYKREEDEIVVVIDKDSSTLEVIEYIEGLVNVGFCYRFHSLNGDFSQHKNYLNVLCEGDYIFNIDADEIPDSRLITLLPELLSSNSEVDAFWIPRVNIVSNITYEHIEKWGWTINSKGWINFPDAQLRLFKNDFNIRWENKVHERLTGYETISSLPNEEQYSLLHIKDIKRQEKQNSYYDTL
jgi:glycosyltransferase involved in cell wall biosynthesis